MSDHPAFARGNCAVITGAADGIGLAAAKHFAANGMHVLLSDIDSEKLANALRQVEAVAATPNSVDSLRIDVSRFDEVARLRDQAFQRFGTVDILMNNAGTSLNTTSWGDLEHWQRLLAVNLWGVVHGVQAFTEAMIAQQRPALIINTGSKQGITNPPGNPAYNVSKAGVKAATEMLQHELRNHERCLVSAHLLVPGYTYTGLTRRRVSEKPAGAWTPGQVVEYLLAGVNAGRFYIVCPDNEVTSADDAKRILWGAGDLAYNRTPLSRWDSDYDDQFADFDPDL